MSYGYRSAAIAVVLTAIFGVALGQEIQRPTVDLDKPQRQEAPAAAGNQNSNAKQPDTSSLLPALEKIEAAIRSLKTEVDKKEGDQKDQREKADLVAQQEMSQWAFWMMIPTWITTCLTAVALFAILGTLHHTRRAADYAKDMVAEAAKTTEAALQTVKAERAWMTFVRFDTHYLTNSTVYGEFTNSTVAFSVVWQNVGRSPAISVSLYSEIQCRSKSDGVYCFTENATDGPESRSTTVGPTIIIKNPLRALSSGQYKCIIDSSIRVFLYNKVVYKTIFDDTESLHFAEVCFEVLFAGFDPRLCGRI